MVIPAWANPQTLTQREAPPAMNTTAVARPNGIETAAHEHSGTILILDEIHLAHPKTLLRDVFLLGNGGGKLRYKRETVNWTLDFFVTGEYSLPAFCRKHGLELKAGQQRRLLSIPADAGTGFGSFDRIDTIPGVTTAKQFAEKIESWAKQSKGGAAGCRTQWL
jgi:putative DNA primase/helicase